MNDLQLAATMSRSLPDPLAPWAFGISVLSLVISGLVAYRAELRGPAVWVRLLSPPDHWDDSCIVPVPGTANHTMLGVNQNFPDAPIDIAFSGDCHATVDNDGPKSGALWGLSIDFAGIPALWRASAWPNLEEPLTVEGKSGQAFAQPIRLSCDQVRVEDAYRDLCRDSQPLIVRLTYHRHGLLARGVERRAELKVPKEPLQVAFRSWAESHGRQL